MKKKQKTASISVEATKMLEQLLAENFPGKTVQVGRHLSNNILKGGNHIIEMIREGYADQAEKERQDQKGYRAKAKAKKDRENQVGQLSLHPIDLIDDAIAILRQAKADAKQTAALNF